MITCRLDAASERPCSAAVAARSVGAGDRRVLLRHILPNIAPSLVVLGTMRLGVLVLAGCALAALDVWHSKINPTGSHVC